MIGILVNSFASGGAERAVSVLSNYYYENNIKHKLLILWNIFEYEIQDKDNVIVLHNYIPYFLQKHKIICLILFPFILKKIIKQNNITSIQSHTYISNYVNILTRILKSKHKVIIVNRGSKYLHPVSLKERINFHIVKILYPKADTIVCVSEQMKDRVQKVTNHKSVVCIYNPYNIDKIKALSEQPIANPNFSFSPNYKYVITAGRLIQLKNFGLLIQAFYEFSKTNRNYKLLVLGEGRLGKELQQQIDELKISNSVILLGRVENPYQYFKNSHFFIFTSTSEGFPNVLIEAQACNLAVASTDCFSGPSEILEKTDEQKNEVIFGKYGLLFPVNNLQATTEALKILSNTLIVEKYKYVLNDSISRFSVEKIANQYLKL